MYIKEDNYKRRAWGKKNMVITNFECTAIVNEQMKDDKPAQEAKNSPNEDHLWMDHGS